MVLAIDKARATGYTDQEIADYLAQQNPKILDARKAGYSDGEILTHLGTPQQMTGVLREPALAGSEAVKGAASLSLLPKMVGDLENKYITSNFGEPDKTGAPNPGQKVMQALTDAGVINRPDLQPQSAGERFLAAGSRAVGGALPFIATGGASAAPYGLAQAAGAGVAPQGLHEAGINNPWLDFAASVAGGAAGGALESAGARTLNSLQGNITPMAEAYEAAGMTPRLAGDVTQSKPLQAIQAATTKFPYGTSGAKEAAQDTVKDFGNSVEDLASSYGKSRTLQEAGKNLQDEGGKWLDSFKTTSGKKWDAVTDAIGANTPTPLTNTESTIEALKGQAPFNPKLQSFLGSKLVNDIHDIISESRPSSSPNPYTTGGDVSYTTSSVSHPAQSFIPNEDSSTPYFVPESPITAFNPTESSVAQYLSNQNIASTIIGKPSLGNPPLPISWKQAQQIRSRVGQYLENPDLIADAGTAQAKQLYASLSQDMQNAAALKGPAAQSAFNEANAFTRAGHDFIDTTLNPIMNAATPERAASTILSGARQGGSQLQAIRAQMPDAADELAAFRLRDAALTPNNTPTGNAVSPTMFSTAFNPKSRMSSEAFDALYPDAADQNKINALSFVGQGMKNTESYVNHSNTTGSLETAAPIVAAIEMANKGFEYGGIPGAIAGGAAGTITPWATGKALSGITTSPALINTLSGAPASSAQGLPWWMQQGGAAFGFAAPNQNQQQ